MSESYRLACFEYHASTGFWDVFGNCSSIYFCEILSSYSLVHSVKTELVVSEVFKWDRRVRVASQSRLFYWREMAEGKDQLQYSASISWRLLSALI